MDEVERGKHILAAAKSLKAYRLGDSKIAAFLYATSFTGRAGLLASALRHHAGIDEKLLTILAAEEGLAPIEVTERIVPWLERAGLCRISYSASGEQQLDSLVLTYDGVLAAVSSLYDSLNPTPEDVACLHVLGLASQIPQAESDVLQAIAREFGEETATTGVELAKAYGIVSVREGKGLPEPYLFSQRLWVHSIGRTAKALGDLDNTDRALVQEFVDRVRQYQGLPEPVLHAFAREHAAEHLLDLAIGIGLLNRTDIQMANGTSRRFLTSPHFYEDLADEFGEDMLDRVKIFLDSIRNGQHYGDAWTGRIRDPEILLTKLVNRGEIGPCTAIGRDYVTSEKAGIVKVRRIAPESSQYFMEAVQRDTIGKVLEVVRAGRIEGAQGPMAPSHISEGSHFRSIEQHRIELGDLPGQMQEAERAIILRLREQ